jgi:uncharacterized protein (TIRG00374 family)
MKVDAGNTMRRAPEETNPSSPALPWEIPEEFGTPDHPRVIDSAPPERVHDLRDIMNLVIFVVLGAAVVFVTLALRGTTSGVESDVRQVGSVFQWLVQIPFLLLLSLVMIIVIGGILIRLALNREWTQVIGSAIAIICGFALAQIVFHGIVLLIPVKALNAFAPFNALNGFSTLDWFLTVTAFLTAAGPRSSNKSLKWGWNTTFIASAIIVLTGTASLSSTLLALCIGRILGLAIRFIVGSKPTGASGKQLITLLESLGYRPLILQRIDNAAITPLIDDKTDFSRLYELTCESTDKTSNANETYIVSVVDASHHTAGYLSQLWNWLKFSGLSVRAYRSITDVTQHHFSVMLFLEKHRLFELDPCSVGEQNDSAVIVYRKLTEPIEEFDVKTASDDELVELFTYLERLHSQGVAHRNISWASFGKVGSHISLFGWQNGELINSRSHLQIDRVQLITMLTIEVGLERTLAAAQQVLSPKQLTSIAPFVQSVAIPPQTKSAEGWRRGILKEIRVKLEELCPADEPLATEHVELARFNVRKFLSIVLLLIAVVVVFTQMNFNDILHALQTANPWFALVSFGLGIVSWCGSAFALGVFIDKDKRQYDGILGTQAVASFTAVSVPASVGPFAVNFQHLRKIGYSGPAASAVATADMVAEFSTTFLFFLILGLFTGQDSLAGMIPGKTVAIAIGVIAILVSIAMAIRPLRHLMHERLFPLIRSYTRQIVSLMSRPSRLGIAAVGSIVQNAGLGVGFWFALQAFGYQAPFFETIFLFLLANAAGSAVPTPGGLGAVEAALTLAFTTTGIPATIVVPATLVFRFATYWARIPLGYLAMKYMEKHNQL